MPFVFLYKIPPFISSCVFSWIYDHHHYHEHVHDHHDHHDHHGHHDHHDHHHHNLQRHDDQATAGLDGAVILYDFKTEFDLIVRCYIQVRDCSKSGYKLLCYGKTAVKVE